MLFGLRNRANSLIKKYEKQYATLGDTALLENTARLREGLRQGAGLSRVLPEAFAAVREAAFRELGYRHHPEQLMAGIALTTGKLVEMKTGEGKTLALTAPAFLLALEGKGVHLVTANDYLARRDCAAMGGVYARLGLSCAVITAGPGQFRYNPATRTLSSCTRREAYRADLTYGTAPAFGFDYLRDNLAKDRAARVQRGRHFAILDEADTILLDEARLPLIISGRDARPVENFYRAAELVKRLEPGLDYRVMEEKRAASFTEEGLRKLAGWLALPEPEALYRSGEDWLYYLNATLLARALYRREEDYLVEHSLEPGPTHPEESRGAFNLRQPAGNGLVQTSGNIPLPRPGRLVLVERERSGRKLEGRRLGEGLHQALEALEGLVVQPGRTTGATISLQGYFGGYTGLSGLSGTLLADRDILHKLYGLEVVPVPTHKPCRRVEAGPLVYRRSEEVLEGLVAEAIRIRESGAPVLIGTTGIGESRLVSALLEELAIPHLVLDASQTEEEAHIIAQAGYPGRITVATSMAGRGTDIVLGGRYEDHLEHLARKRGLVARVDRGSPAWQTLEEDSRRRPGWARELVELAGGLHVLGLGLRGSRREEQQLVGRAGRQGDPGYSRQFWSLEDPPVKKWGGKTVEEYITEPGAGEWGRPLPGSVWLKLAAQCRSKEEASRYEELRRGIEFDGVLRLQREAFYRDRAAVLEADAAELKTLVLKMVYEELAQLPFLVPDGRAQKSTLLDEVGVVFGSAVSAELKRYLARKKPADRAEPEKWLAGKLADRYENWEKAQGIECLAEVVRLKLLEGLDRQWAEYLSPLEELRKGIYLRSYGGQNPLREYQRDGYRLWQEFQTLTRKTLLQEIFTGNLIISGDSGNHLA